MVKRTILNATTKYSPTEATVRAESVNELRCLQKPLFDRSRKSCTRHHYVSSRDQANNKYYKSSTNTESISIPLQVQISLTVPPCTPTAPYTTPDATPSNSDTDASISTLSLENLCCSETSSPNQPQLTDTFNQNERPHFSNVTCHTSRLFSSSPSTTNVNNPISVFSVQSRANSPSTDAGDSISMMRVHSGSPSTPSNIFNRNSIKKTQCRSPSEALYIKQIPSNSKIFHEKYPQSSKMFQQKYSCQKKSMEVKAVPNTVIMERDGSVKHCTVYIPLAASEKDAKPEVETHRQVKRNVKTTMGKSYSTHSKFTNRFSNHLISKSLSCDTTKNNIPKKTSKKISKKESKIQEKHFDESTEALLPQNRHKKGDLTFSDVLNTLSNITEEKSNKIYLDDKQSDEETENSCNPVSKTEIKIWGDSVIRNKESRAQQREPKRCQSRKKDKREERNPSTNPTVQNMIRKLSAKNVKKSLLTGYRDDNEVRISKFDYRTLVLS